MDEEALWLELNSFAYELKEMESVRARSLDFQVSTPTHTPRSHPMHTPRSHRIVYNKSMQHDKKYRFMAVFERWRVKPQSGSQFFQRVRNRNSDKKL